MSWESLTAKFKGQATIQTAPVATQEALRRLATAAKVLFPSANAFVRFNDTFKALTTDVLFQGRYFEALQGVPQQDCQAVMEIMPVSDIVALWGNGETVEEATEAVVARLFPTATVVGFEPAVPPAPAIVAAEVDW